MKLQDALNILGLTGEVASLDEAKIAYRRACAKYHPDRNPGGLEMMKAVNAAWEALQKLDWDRPVVGEESRDNNYGESLMAAINAVVGLPNIVIEVCGAWVWLPGDTRPVKDVIKAAGYKWASGKKQWYFRPEEWKRSKRSGEWSMDRIRDTWGSKEIRNRARDSLEIEE